MKYFFILIVFWKITLTSYSQNLEISNSTLHKLFDKEAGLLYLFSSDSLITIDLANLIIKDKQVLETVSFELVDFVPLLIKEHFYFVEKQGGQVFELKGTKIERIDKSFSHKMQVYSSIFIHEDKIYRYGGYGFWSARSMMTAFDFDSFQWELVTIKGNEVPLGRFNSVLSIDQDELFIFGGLSVDENNELIVLNDLWRFSFQTKMWTFLGSSDLDFFNSFKGEFGYASFDFFDQLGIFKFQEGPQLYYLDKASMQLQKIESNNLVTKQIRNLLPFSFGDKLFLFTSTNKFDKIEIISQEKDKIFSQFGEEIVFIKSSGFEVKYLYFILVTLILSILFYFFYRKATLTYLYPEYLQKGIRRIQVEEKEYKILKYMLQNDAGMENAVLLSYTSEDQYAQSHNTKLKNARIESINNKLQSVLKSDQKMILQKDSKIDKRYKVYTLSYRNIIIKNS